MHAKANVVLICCYKLKRILTALKRFSLSFCGSDRQGTTDIINVMYHTPAQQLDNAVYRKAFFTLELFKNRPTNIIIIIIEQFCCTH
jgi:hypothetical protein